MIASARGRIFTAGFSVTLALSVWACGVSTKETAQAPAEEESTAAVSAPLTGTSCQALDIATHSAGNDSMFAIKPDGTVWGWGFDNEPYPLGNPSPNPTYSGAVISPVQIQGVVPAPATNPAQQLAIHASGGCARLKDGSVSCWGQQLGNVGTDPPPAATVVVMDNAGVPGAALTGAIGVTAGDAHACAWKADGTAYCWGDDTVGQLGDEYYPYYVTGATTTSAVPMTGATGIVQVAAAGSTTCVLTGSSVTAPTLPNQVYCTGNSYHGELGQGDLAQVGHLTPVSNPSKLAFGALYAGSVSGGVATFCATTIKSAGGTQQTYCWGDNVQGQASIAAPTSANQIIKFPTLVDSDVGATWAVGGGNGCEVNAAGALSCWGINTAHQIPGAPSTVGVKTAISGLTNPTSTFSNAVLKVAIGAEHICAYSASALYCWGNNEWGQIGAGSSASFLGVTQIHLAAAVATACGNHCGTMTNSCGETQDCGDCGDNAYCLPATHVCKALPACRTPAQCCERAGGYWSGKYCE